MTASDKIFWISSLVFLVVGIVAMALVWENIYPVLSAFNESASAKQTADLFAPAQVNTWLDIIFICAFFSFSVLISVILPFLIVTTPFTIFAIFLLSFIYAYIVALVGNALVDFYLSVNVQLPLTYLLLDNLVIIEVVFFMVMALIMFMKKNGGGGGLYYQ